MWLLTHTPLSHLFLRKTLLKSRSTGGQQVKAAGVCMADCTAGVLNLMAWKTYWVSLCAYPKPREVIAAWSSLGGDYSLSLEKKVEVLSCLLTHYRSLGGHFNLKAKLTSSKPLAVLESDVNAVFLWFKGVCNQQNDVIKPKKVESQFKN